MNKGGRRTHTEGKPPVIGRTTGAPADNCQHADETQQPDLRINGHRIVADRRVIPHGSGDRRQEEQGRNDEIGSKGNDDRKCGQLHPQRQKQEKQIPV